MKKYLKLFAFFMVFVGLLSSEIVHAQNEGKPNVLFIAVDDLKPMIGAYGNEEIHTPNIDRMAEAGVTFLNNHTQEAVCGPSRASLLTGWRPDKTEIWRLKVMIRDKNPDIVTLPQHFKENGYTTAALGKVFDKRSVDKDHDKRSWSLSYRKIRPEFHLEEYGEPFVHYQSPRTKKIAQKYMQEATKKGLKSWEKRRYALEHIKPSTEKLDVPDEAYLDGLFAKKGAELMEQFAKTDEPFFLAVGFKKPHLPFVAPKKYWGLYDRDEIETSEWQKHSANGPDIAYHRFGELRSYTDIEPAMNEDYEINTSKQKELIHGYMAAVSYIDAQVGRLMAKLDELGLRENTIVVLWGDHGWHLGDHGLWCKHSNFEQATRSPLIIMAPGIEKGLKVSSPTEFLDVYPTLVDMAGLNAPQKLAGKSLTPILKGKTLRVKDFAISQYHRRKDVMGYAMRTDRYRYVEWHDNNYRSSDPYNPDNIIARELYDYKTDPLETRNVVDDSTYEEIAAELKDRLKIFLSQQNETL